MEYNIYEDRLVLMLACAGTEPPLPDISLRGFYVVFQANI